jgi:hypothetical protein
MTATRALACSVLTAITTAAPAAAPEVTLATVLQRAGAYVGRLEQVVSGIVAEERYRQRWTVLPRGWPLTGDQRDRALTSDFLIVKLDSAGIWLQFRDVFDVDGAPVRDRDERLLKLLLEPAGSPTEHIESILTESARYNIGNVERNVNTPLLALLFLDPRHQERFRFFRTRDRTPLLGRNGPERPSTLDAARLPADIWVVRFEEHKQRAVIHSDSGGDLPSHGRFWIEPATGRVRMTELVAEDRTVRATIDVGYRSDPLDGMLLPQVMQERYEGRTNKSIIEGWATYDRFRQFIVNVDEKFLLKK